jgi:hypothetical protein
MASAFTAREMTLLACAFRAMDNVPKINYAKMAELAGMSNQNSAANAWREVRKKIDAADETAEAMADATTPKTIKATGRKRKTKNADEDDDVEMEVTPKKKRARKPAATKENGDVETEKKTPGPKKGGRKSAAPKEDVEDSEHKMENPEVAADDDESISNEEV